MVTKGQALFGKTEVSSDLGERRGEAKTEKMINKHADICNLDANMCHGILSD